MYLPRNPFTPGLHEVFTPAQYLTRYLVFRCWDIQNHPTPHRPSCFTTSTDLYLLDMCCLNATKRRIDETLLDLAGIRTGFWQEPAGFQNWLVYAWKRLQELEDGQDFAVLWSQTLASRQTEILAWWFKSSLGDAAPGFGLQEFRDACHKYDVSPDLSLVAQGFDEDQSTVLQIWNQ